MTYMDVCISGPTCWNNAIMWTFRTVVFATIPLCSILAVPLLDLVERRNAVSSQGRKWTGGIIPYTISPLYSVSIRNTIIAAMRELEQDVNNVTGDCITFIPRTNETNYIRIYPGIGCGAYLGMLGTGRQDVSLGEGCESKGVMLHELVHVLGFWHEHNRPDRDTYINVNLTNVRNNQGWDFAKVSASMLNTLNTPYDMESITHYSPYAQAKDLTIPVITPKPGQAAGIKLGQRMALSNWDVVRIQRWYGCTEDTSHITRPLLTDSLARCDFTSDICNLTHDTTSDFLWTVQEGSSGAGPRAGNTNGADSYLVARQAGHTGTARILTPSFSAGAICVDFFVFQRGPSSYLNISVSWPRIASLVMATFQEINSNEWLHVQVNINVSVGAAFQIKFEAHVSSGDVAIDDLNIYKGQCL